MTNLRASLKKICKVITATAVLGLGGWVVGGRIHEWAKLEPVAAQIVPGFPVAPWTAVGSSGSVDELSIPYFGFTGPSAGYRATPISVQPLEFRYNVVNVHHAVNAAGGVPTVTIPGWTQMEFGAQTPGTSFAEATLYRVNRCTGQEAPICRIYHSNTPAPGACRVCPQPFPNTAVNFSGYLYYVRVVLDRNTSLENPMVHTLRIY